MDCMYGSGCQLYGWSNMGPALNAPLQMKGTSVGTCMRRHGGGEDVI